MTIAILEYIDIDFIGETASGKTSIYEVLTKDETILGEVRWFSRWRQYAFFPVGDTVYSAGCLADIERFVEAATKTHRSVKS